VGGGQARRYGILVVQTMLIGLGADSERLNPEVHEGRSRQNPFHFVFFVALLRVLRVLRVEIFSSYFWQLTGSARIKPSPIRL
jgi:hypothetical protein